MQNFHLTQLQPTITRPATPITWPYLSDEPLPWDEHIGICDPLPTALLSEWITSPRFEAAQRRLANMQRQNEFAQFQAQLTGSLENEYAIDIRSVLANARNQRKHFIPIYHDIEGLNSVCYGFGVIPAQRRSHLAYEEVVSAQDPGLMTVLKGTITEGGEPVRYAHELRIRFYGCIERAFKDVFADLLPKFDQAGIERRLDYIHCLLVSLNLHPEQVIRNRDYLNQVLTEPAAA
ncbi:hypothetical protein [Neopusillimonas maritima]|uniref:Uncharacterized protein n=1 Tax=Neopusillimonas maritima TaxID=2026239 RepID=A0A3A1YUX9_9BURK|nr:hypothetical protein [Neopusillimonas maritima]RIY41089.1 hypothetical protein CJP73_08035 [Neopusillimonas maritima]